MDAPRYGPYAQHPPKFIAGARGLDFINTVEWRTDPDARVERLSDYAELATWCAKAGLISAAEARRLIGAAHRQPQRARAVLRQAIDLRETCVALLRHPQEARPIRALDRRLQAVHCRPTLEIGPDGVLQSGLAPVGPALDRPLALIALELVSFLGSRRVEHVRLCANPRCGWMFIDTSRNHSRRWCEMATCGNRSKARAHYVRRFA